MVSFTTEGTCSRGAFASLQDRLLRLVRQETLAPSFLLPFPDHLLFPLFEITGAPGLAEARRTTSGEYLFIQASDLTPNAFLPPVLGILIVTVLCSFWPAFSAMRQEPRDAIAGR